MTTTKDVLIAGAGPTGLTMANVLARSGVSFRVLDKKAGPVEETRALVMHAKTLELLDKLGLADWAIEEGRRLGAAVLLKEGKRAGKLSFFDDGRDERTPYPFALVYEQDRIERLLIRGLEEAGGGVEWGTELLSLTPSADGVRAVVRHPDGSEETIEAGWVVGADGASSPVRHALGLSFEGDTYEESLFLADVEMESELDPRQAHLDLTREGFYAFFPMPGEKRFRLVGRVPTELEGKEEIAAGDVQEVFDEHSGVKIRITDARWTSVYRIHRRMTERFRVGRVFLVGDAAHIHSPAGGQGMNTGIGDAYNLGWKLALVAKGAAKPGLLDSYEPERMPFARAILNGSDRGFSLQVATNPVAQRLKLLAVPLLFRLVSLMPPLRRRAFWFISQLWTGYRDSPAVMESGPVKKGPRAGDRAPYGLFEVGPRKGTGVFDLLEGTGHHMLLFEGPRPGPGLDAVERDLRMLLDQYEADIVLHRVPAGDRALHERYGAEAATLFLVRPDGHVAYRGRPAELYEFEAYLDGWFERCGIREQASAASRVEQTARLDSRLGGSRSFSFEAGTRRVCMPGGHSFKGTSENPLKANFAELPFHALQ